MNRKLGGLLCPGGPLYPTFPYNMTLKGQGQSLTSGQSGQGHVMTQMGHISYQSIRLAETNVLTPTPRL